MYKRGKTNRNIAELERSSGLTRDLANITIVTKRFMDLLDHHVP